MIPILFERDEMEFLSNGICRLPDTISCTVKQNKSIYICELKYPITGENYSKIQEGRIIAVIHDDKKDIQPFDIYGRSAPINGIVTFYAQHISYRLGKIVLRPFEAQTIVDAMAQIPIMAMTSCPFTFWTDKVTAAPFSVSYPKTIKETLRGSSGSLVDAFGTGEYEFDKFVVKLYAHKGVDSGVEIRYGKNLTDIVKDYDESGISNAVVPYWFNSDSGELVMLSGDGILVPEAFEDSEDDLLVVPLDLSSEFQEKPTEDELRELAIRKLDANKPWTPVDTIDVNFVALWQTEEYKAVAPLQRLSLYDTASVFYKALGVNAVKFKVVEVVYNVLLERYDKLSLGSAKATYGETVTGGMQAEFSEVRNEIANKPSKSFVQTAVENATETITGGLGGYKYDVLDADGKPVETLYMDTDSIETAVHILRINRNGIAFSNEGYNGPYRSAWTIDGTFNADFILAGTIIANRIKGGTLTLGSLDNDSGVLEVRDEANNLVVRADNTGLKVYESDGSYVVMNATDGFAGYDRNGTKIYWAAAQEFHMRNAQVEYDFTLAQTMRYIPITTPNNRGVGLVPYAGGVN